VCVEPQQDLSNVCSGFSNSGAQKKKAQQDTQQTIISTQGSPVQRGAALGIGCLHIDTMLQQCGDKTGMALDRSNQECSVLLVVSHFGRTPCV
jgi:hypothetical protein